jgi:anthranilate synthase/aminodeoxychorismate synthase-like glutamine amidotransferase
VILLIDNYDSFVFNLERFLRELGGATRTVRNDAVTLDAIHRMEPQAIVISPGPCTPLEAGISLEVVAEFSGKVPLLGVCLGHQAIAASAGGRVIRAPRPVHGHTTAIHHAGTRLFAGIPSPFPAGRYHSLVVEEATLPAELRVTARSSDGVLMALEHRRHPVWGVQFHPESILTGGGHQLLRNFLNLCGLEAGAVPPPEHVPPAEEVDFYRQPIDAHALPPW